MPVTVQHILNHLTKLAPLSLAESWDNAGLLLGDLKADVHSIVVALDPSTEVVDFAAEKSANLLVTHHPVFLTPPSRFLEEDPVGGVVLQCARDGLNLIAMHTNLDNAEGGVGDALAARLNLGNVRVLAPVHQDAYCKVAVFVPTDQVEQVRDAMANAGAGMIGEYSHCSFQTPGTGAFLPSDKANPSIGSLGNLERVEEFRLEMRVSKSQLPLVLDRMIAAHPYEEVAYDVYSLENPGKPLGCLKIGELDPPLAAIVFLDSVVSSLNAESVRIIGDLPEFVRSVAVCGGSGSSFMDVVADSEADVYVTGDVKHHDALRAREWGQAVVDVGHAVSEQVAVDLLELWLRDCLEGLDGVEFHRAQEPPPWTEYRRSVAVT